MAEVISMADIEASAARLGIDLSSINLDSIQLPPGVNFGIQSDDDGDLYQDDPLEFEEMDYDLLCVFLFISDDDGDLYQDDPLEFESLYQDLYLDYWKQCGYYVMRFMRQIIVEIETIERDGLRSIVLVQITSNKPFIILQSQC